MLHPAWIEREEPLARCPLRACRRDGACRHPTERDPCRRLHETKDAARYKLAAKLERYMKEMIRRNPNRVTHPAGSPEQQRRLYGFYDLLRAADEAECARQKAKAQT